MSSSRFWLFLGAVLSGLAVAAGAFAAHGLDGWFHTQYAGRHFEKKTFVEGRETIVSKAPLAEKLLADFKTGAAYQMYHGLALLVVGLLLQRSPCRTLNVAGCAFLLGIVGFSGGLYAYTLLDARWVGMFIVPLGGTLFLVGWSTLATAMLRRPAATGDHIQIAMRPPTRG